MPHLSSPKLSLCSSSVPISENTKAGIFVLSLNQTSKSKVMGACTYALINPSIASPTCPSSHAPRAPRHPPFSPLGAPQAVRLPSVAALCGRSDYWRARGWRPCWLVGGAPAAAVAIAVALPPPFCGAHKKGARPLWHPLWGPPKGPAARPYGRPRWVDESGGHTHGTHTPLGPRGAPVGCGEYRGRRPLGRGRERAAAGAGRQSALPPPPSQTCVSASSLDAHGRGARPDPSCRA